MPLDILNHIYSFLSYKQELELPLMKLASTEIVSGVSGESEEKIRDVFDKAVVRIDYPLLIRIIENYLHIKIY